RSTSPVCRLRPSWPRRPTGCRRRRAPRGKRRESPAAVAKYGKQLLHKEIRRADIDREELIEILDRNFLDCRSFRDPCIGDKDVQAISDDAAGLLGKLAGAVRGGEVHRYGIRSATALAYL